MPWIWGFGPFWPGLAGFVFVAVIASTAWLIQRKPHV